MGPGRQLNNSAPPRPKWRGHFCSTERKVKHHADENTKDVF